MKFRDTVRQAIASRRVRAREELTPEQRKRFRKFTRKFLRGEVIAFNVPDDAVNPWDEEYGIERAK